MSAIHHVRISINDLTFLGCCLVVYDCRQAWLVDLSWQVLTQARVNRLCEVLRSVQVHQVWEGGSRHLTRRVELRLVGKTRGLFLNSLLRRLHPLNILVQLLMGLPILIHVHWPSRVVCCFKLSDLVLVRVVEMRGKHEVILHRISQLSCDL